jgi:hypothetical protein
MIDESRTGDDESRTGSKTGREDIMDTAAGSHCFTISRVARLYPHAHVRCRGEPAPPADGRAGAVASSDRYVWRRQRAGTGVPACVLYVWPFGRSCFPP